MKATKMSSRKATPLWIHDAAKPPVPMSRANLVGTDAQGYYSEAWIQKLLHEHPELFPIGEIEAGFGNLIPLCRELPVSFGGDKFGSLDNLFITRDGELVLVEVKLWRNPDARRLVVAQALDYAAAVFQMSCEKLQAAVLQSRRKDGLTESSLFEIVAKHSNDSELSDADSSGADSNGLDEASFYDSLARNLERGRAIIAAVGDGIREDIHSLAGLLQSHAGHRFTFALVELAVYETLETSVRLVLPSVLAKTVLIERGVVRIEGTFPAGQRLIVEPPTSGTSQPPSGRRMGIREDEFFETLGEKDPKLPEVLKAFLAKAEGFGVYAEFQGSLNLKRSLPTGQPLNMGYITKGGIVDLGTSTYWSDLEVARIYSETLARVLGGTVVQGKRAKDLFVHVKAKLPRLSDLLPQNEQAWLDAMERYIRENLSVQQEE